MKILVLDSANDKPLANSTIQIQIRGKDSGFLTLTTDNSGYLQINDKYKNQQISYTNGDTKGLWVAATDKTKLYVSKHH